MAMKVSMGTRELELGGPYLGELRDSTSLRNDGAALRARLEQDGYLLIRGLHDVAKVKAARRLVLENLAANRQLDPARPLDDAVPAAGAGGKFLGGAKALTHTPAFLALVESPEVYEFFGSLLDGPVLTYDYKWLRVVGPGGFTGAHYDIVYMGRGTQEVCTLWTPLGDVPFALGPLAIWSGSHRLEKLKATYGKMDVDRDHVDGWFSDDPVELQDRYGGRWLTAEFASGDALIFGMFTMHGSLNNTRNCYRISCDVRFQRADAPVDERWIGPNPKAHYAWRKGTMVGMAEARQKWNV